MALPPTMVMVLATVVIILAARPLDFILPATESRDEWPVPVLRAEPGPELGPVVVVHARGDIDVRSVPQHEPVPPPERVVYVPGWRSSGVTPGPASPRLQKRRGQSPDEARWPRPGSIVQSQ
jgi:hypothetical protein